MDRLTLKNKDMMWPTVIWHKTQIIVYYLGEKEEDNKAYFTPGIDFEEFFLHLDKGGSVFVTTLPVKQNENASRQESNLLSDMI